MQPRNQETYRHIVKYQLDLVDSLTSSFVLNVDWKPFFYLLEHAGNLSFYNIDDRAKEFIQTAQRLLILYKGSSKLYSILDDTEYFTRGGSEFIPAPDELLFEPFFTDLLLLLLDIKDKSKQSVISIAKCSSFSGLLTNKTENILLKYLQDLNDDVDTLKDEDDLHITSYLCAVKSIRIRDYISSNFTIHSDELSKRKYSSKEIYLFEDVNSLYQNSHLIDKLQIHNFELFTAQELCELIIGVNALHLIPYLKQREDYRSLKGYDCTKEVTTKEAILFSEEAGVLLPVCRNQVVFDHRQNKALKNGLSLQELYDKNACYKTEFFKFMLHSEHVKHIPLSITLDDLSASDTEQFLELKRKGYNIYTKGKVNVWKIVDDPDIIFYAENATLPLVFDPLCDIPLNYGLDEKPRTVNYNQIPAFIQKLKHVIEGKMIFSYNISKDIQKMIKYLKRDRMLDMYKDYVELLNIYQSLSK